MGNKRGWNNIYERNTETRSRKYSFKSFVDEIVGRSEPTEEKVAEIINVILTFQKNQGIFENFHARWIVQITGERGDHSPNATNLDIIAYPGCSVTVEYLMLALVEIGFCDSFRLDILKAVFRDFWSSSLHTQQVIVEVFNRVATHPDYQNLLDVKRPDSRTWGPGPA